MDKKQSTSLKFDWTNIVEPHPRQDPPAEMLGCGGSGGGLPPENCRGPLIKWF